ncbi:S-layer domain protein [Synechococcus sp. PCC 7335]|nr:S-layer domain protein [Synechococcus sp. PCC 7335]
MKLFRLTVTALAATTVAVTAGNLPLAIAQNPLASETSTAIELAQSSMFGMQETDQDPYLLVANPTSKIGGSQRYGLMILEQRQPAPPAQPCFSTSGSNPTVVTPLTFNNSACRRSTDTNGYLLRTAGNDIKYTPVLVEENGVLVLYANPSPFAGSGARKFIIGQTDGIVPGGYTQIFLKPGWRLAKQTFEGNVTGRTYIANDSTAAELIEQSEAIIAGPTDPDVTTPIVVPVPGGESFPDVAGDIYESEINRAVQLGFISGFAEDNTFRPRATVTREQMMSIVLEALDLAPESDALASDLPFSDVSASRWSAAKIARAAELGIVEGYPDGSFRPADELTRAQLIAAMRRVAQYINDDDDLEENQPGDTFSDIDGHWAESAISELSTFCGISTPLNEVGNEFRPDSPAQRNYAAAAMIRLLDCSQLLENDGELL